MGVSCDTTTTLAASCRFLFPYLPFSPSPRLLLFPALILQPAPISLLGDRLHSTLAPSMHMHLLLHLPLHQPMHPPLHLLLHSLTLLHLHLLLPQQFMQGSQSFPLSPHSKEGHIL